MFAGTYIKSQEDFMYFKEKRFYIQSINAYSCVQVEIIKGEYKSCPIDDIKSFFQKGNQLYIVTDSGETEIDSLKICGPIYNS